MKCAAVRYTYHSQKLAAHCWAERLSTGDYVYHHLEKNQCDVVVIQFAQTGRSCSLKCVTDIDTVLHQSFRNLHQSRKGRNMTCLAS
jgi:hypothetical protein